MRVVTFQSSEILDTILDKGIIATRGKLHVSSPKQLGFREDNITYIQVDNKTIQLDESNKDTDYHDALSEIHHGNEVWRIYPFYAYHKHRYCGDMCHMSIQLIYRLCSHFIGAMGFERRDIIELEVPDEYIMRKRNNGDYEDVVLPCIKREWLVSALRFADYTTEPVYGELALAYKNYVYHDGTYRMCYSNSVVFNGHGYGDELECFKSPDLLLKVSDKSIQEDYVQSGIWSLFVRYMYVIRHGMKMSEIASVNLRAARTEMPDKIDPAMIHAFNICKDSLIKDCNVTVYDTSLNYKDRVLLLRK